MDLDLTRFGNVANDLTTFARHKHAPDASPTFRNVAELIENGGPSIVFQPIVHIETNRLLGVEALSRFPSALGTQLWFELASSVGLSVELEMSAARNALATVDEATRERLGWEFVGINISPRTLLDPRFDELLAEHIAHHVVIELSDQREQTDWALVRRYIARTRELGCRIAINSLTCDPSVQFDRLLEVAPEIIKLDTGYTSTLVDNNRRRGAAEHLLRKCIQRGVFVVAVGVEHEAGLAALAELGVDAAQGYLLGKPQPIECFQPVEAGLGLGDIMRGVVWA